MSQIWGAKFQYLAPSPSKGFPVPALAHAIFFSSFGKLFLFETLFSVGSFAPFDFHHFSYFLLCSLFSSKMSLNREARSENRRGSWSYRPPPPRTRSKDSPQTTIEAGSSSRCRRFKSYGSNSPMWGFKDFWGPNNEESTISEASSKGFTLRIPFVSLFG